MKRIAIIPARGGSKRLPGKNKIKFMGKPMIAHTIESSIRSEMFDTIVVSSDDQDILDIAADYEVVCDSRSSLLSSDDARVTDVCFDYITRNKLEDTYQVLSVLYATSPLRNEQDIIKVVEQVSGDGESAMAVTNFDLPVHQALVFDSENQGKVRPVFPDLISKRSADVPEYSVDNGSTYAVSMKSFLENKSLLTESIGAYVMPRNRSVDIDYPEDFKVLEFYAQQLQSK